MPFTKFSPHNPDLEETLNDDFGNKLTLYHGQFFIEKVNNPENGEFHYYTFTCP